MRSDRLHCHTCGKSCSTPFTPEPTDTPDQGLILRANVECPECMEKRFKAEEIRNDELARLKEQNATLLDQRDKLQQEKRTQFEDLRRIREMADRVTGIDRGRGDDRNPGAVGAVQALIERYEAMLARVGVLADELDVLTTKAMN